MAAHAFCLSGLFSFRTSSFTAPCLRSGRKMGQGDPRDLGQIRGTARQSKDDSADDPNAFWFLLRGGFQLLCLGAAAAR